MPEKTLVSIIIVNYNSTGIWDVVRKSIKAVFNIKHRPLEVIIIDNGSTDNSFDKIKVLVDGYQDKEIKVKLIGLSMNYGFSIGNIIGFNFIDPNSQYVVLINTDLVPEADSLTSLIDYLEEHRDVAGVQGKVLSWDEEVIDTGPAYLTEYGYAYNLGMMNLPSECDKEKYVTYISGCYSVYRVSAIRNVGGLFRPYFFMFGDDTELGIRLWRSCYKLVYLPVIVGRHYGGASYKRRKISSFVRYSGVLSEYAVFIMYERLWLPKVLPRMLLSILQAVIERNKYLLKAMVDGIRYGIRLREKAEEHRFSLCREPRVKLGFIRHMSLLISLFLRRGSDGVKYMHALLSRGLWTENRNE